MLQSIRDKTQGILATLIVGVVAVTFALWGIHYYLEQSKSSTVVAQVNGSKLTQDNFERILRRDQRLFSLTQPGVAMSDTVQQQIQKTTIERWTETAILTQAAEKAHFMVSPQILQQTLASLDMFQQDGKFSAELYQQKIDYLGYTAQEFQKNLQDELLMDQIRYGLVQSAFVLPDELRHAVGTLYQTRDMGYTLIPAQSFLNSAVVKPADIRQYYDNHQQDFMEPEKVKVEYIQIKPSDLRDKTPVSDDDINHYYQTHLTDYSSAPQWQIRFVKLENKSNQDAKATLQRAVALHDAIQKENAFDVAQEQGLTVNDLWVTASSAPPELATLLVKSTTGALLEPVVTDNGVLIVKVEANKPTQIKPLAEVKNAIQERLQNQNADKLMATLSDQLDSLSYEDPTNLQTVSQKLNVPVKVSDWLVRANANSNAAFSGPVIQAAFSNDVLQQGYNSGLLTLNDGSVMVLRLKAHEASVAKPFIAVQDQIKAILTADATKKMAEDKGNAIVKAIQQGQAPKVVVQKNGLLWQEVSGVSRTSTGLNPELIIALFNASLEHADKQPIVSGKLLSNGDYVVFNIQALHRGDEAQLSDKDKMQLALQWAQSLGQMDYAFYSQELNSKAKIKVQLPAKNEDNVSND